MGQQVAAKTFSREDRQRYRRKVRTSLDVFARMLSEARFHPEQRSFGLEIELNLTDDNGDPALVNAVALEAIADPTFQTELGQFNVEINIPPRLLEGRVFFELEHDARASLNNAEERARTVGAHMVLIGILPTIGPRHLNAESFSSNPRYAAPQRADLRRARRGPGDSHRRRGAPLDPRRHDRSRGGLHERSAASAGRA